MGLIPDKSVVSWEHGKWLMHLKCVPSLERQYVVGCHDSTANRKLPLPTDTWEG